jgi:hypothetical protein
MSLMDKVLACAGPTLAPNNDSFFTPCCTGGWSGGFGRDGGGGMKV